VKRRALAAALGLVAGLVLAELGARWLEPEAPEAALAGDIGLRIPDPLLEYRTAPGTGENDARGYRNASAPDRADVVALGDSQTWGVNASRDATWPAVLAELSGLSVYNMGRGGYGSLQYFHQLDEALALDPEWIAVALYLGNDLYDAYSLAYSNDAHATRRHPDPAARAEIEGSAYPDLQRMFFERLAYGRPRHALARWLEDHAALARVLVRALRPPGDPAADRAWAADHAGEGFAYDGPAPSVFHTSYRLAAVDLSLAKVREGLRITLELLAAMAERLEGGPGRARLLVVLLPTKERAYARLVSRAGVPAPWSYVQSVSFEARIARALEERMQERGIRYLDLLPACEDALAAGEAIFPPNADGHFNERGYRLIAERIAADLEAARALTPAGPPG
jgi:hypothetical protein